MTVTQFFTAAAKGIHNLLAVYVYPAILPDHVVPTRKHLNDDGSFANVPVNATVDPAAYVSPTALVHEGATVEAGERIEAGFVKYADGAVSHITDGKPVSAADLFSLPFRRL